jgi:hypothetical protein
MEITFPAGIGRVRGRFKSYKSLQGIAASRDGLGSFFGSPDGEKSHKFTFKIKQKFLG